MNYQEIQLRALEPSDLDFLYDLENDQCLWTVSNTLVPFSKYTLKEYIEFIGTEPAAELFDCSPATTKSWRYGARQPSIKQAKKIIKASGGKLDFESIYGPLEETSED